MSESKHEVVVIGAGLSGLAAADALRRQGVDVLVLEARDRVGGRTFSPTHAGYRFDLGGQWLDRKHTQMHAYVSRFGLETFPQYRAGRNVMDVLGKPRPFYRIIPPLSPRDTATVAWVLAHWSWLAFRYGRVEADGSSRRSQRLREFDQMSIGDCIDSVSGEGARAMLRIAVQLVMAEEPSRISFASWIRYMRNGGGARRLLEVDDGAQDIRVVGGTQQISELLAEELGDRLRLESPVVRIERHEQSDSVAVHTPNGVVRAARVIFALPAAILNNIEVSPAWPAKRQALHEAAFMGNAFKFVLVFDEPYWRKVGLSGETVSDESLIRATFDNTPPDGPASLLGFAIGDGARELAAMTLEQREAYFSKYLARVFGVATPPVRVFAEQDWQAEPYSLGGYTGLLGPGGVTEFGDELGRPIGRVHFAGTETARHFSGYMEGAVRAGLWAADEVLKAGYAWTAVDRRERATPRLSV